MSKIRFMAPAGAIATALAVLGVANSPARALQVTLTDNNSRVDYNLPTLDPTKPSGLYDYLVDGVDQAKQISSWYRVGSATTSNPEKSIYSLTQTNFSKPAANAYTATYTDTAPTPRFTIQTSASLTGNQPGTGTSVLQTTATITNLTNSSLNFNYFILNDYDVNATDNDDTVQAGFSSLTQTVSSLQTDPSETLAITSANPASTATKYQADTVSNLIALLTNGVGNNLTNTSSAGSGDVASVFQFVFTLGTTTQSKSLQITQQRTISGVPVPFEFSPGLGILALGACGAIAELRSKMQKRKSSGSAFSKSLG